MAKHSQASAMDWGRWVIAAVLVLVISLAAWGSVSVLSGDDSDDADDTPTASTETTGPDDRSATGGDTSATGGDDADATTDQAAGTDEAGATQAAPAVEGECGLATVWAAPEVAAAVTAATDRLGNDCFEYDVVTQGSAAAQSALSSGEVEAGQMPDVWIPSSAAWPALVQGSDVNLEVGEVLASSPVLLAGVPQVMAALGDLGVDEQTTFADLLQTYQQMVVQGQDAPLSLRIGDPRTDPATMALLSDPATLGGAAPDEDTRRLLVLLAQSAIQGDPLSALASDPRTIIPATEQQVEQATAAGTELTGVALQGGAGTVQIPFVQVGEPEADGSVNALAEELVSEQAQEGWTALGLQPGTGGAAEAAGEVAPGAVAGIAQLWSAIAPQSRILTLIDISGSMRAEVADGLTRIDLTRQAVQGALPVLPDQTAIGLWYFSTDLDGEGVDFEEVFPMRSLSDEVDGDTTQREALLARSEDLSVPLLHGDTGLHDSLWAAYQHMQQEEHDQESVASVLLLTDGINDDPGGGLSEKAVIDRLEKARESGDRPVTVVLLGMGPEVDEQALQRLAEAAGGESRVIRDPRELPQVFIDVVAERAQ